MLAGILGFHSGTKLYRKVRKYSKARARINWRLTKKVWLPIFFSLQNVHSSVKDAVPDLSLCIIQQKLPINSVEVREVGENSLTISE